MIAWLVCAFAAVALVSSWIVDPASAEIAYLAAFAFVVSTALGALTLAMIGRLTEAKWYMEGARPATESIVATIPLLAVLFVPLALHAPSLARSIVYLAIWAALALALPRWPRPVSALGLPVLALSLTFASFDWFMSLDPDFDSSIYGVYVWSGGFLAALGLVVLLRGSPVALAKLLLTASIFWAYIAWAQALIIWIGGIPRETAWLDARGAGPWAIVILLVVVAKFAVPLPLLLPWTWKRRFPVQAVVAVLALLGHALDACWLVLPARRAPALVSVAAFAALASFLFASRPEPSTEAVPS
ncbi:MAG TPA: hypothetical protein VFF73_11100 [Planctomycetota bacterium]|nr:hypothetical protein [Planctomycetota bacterium]